MKDMKKTLSGEENTTQNTPKRAAKRRASGVGSLRRLCFAAALAAMSLVLGKFLQIPHPFQEFIRISFENLPILLAGIALGPVHALLVGVVADLLGCLLYGYPINPIVTLGAAVVGLTAGVMSHYVIKKPLGARVAAAVAVAHLLGSVLLKSAGLAAWYLAKYELGYIQFLGWRIVNYVMVGVAEGVVLYLLLRNRAFAKHMEEIGQ
ncbi:MAG: folate family ECF transporter S component [Ruminococcaceae bacterium]|nr:folate family ECF transporter S component [Oscillospiraceae bacterium]